MDTAFKTLFKAISGPPAISGRSVITGNRRPYTGAELKDIRSRKGVGRPPEVNLSRRAKILDIRSYSE